VIITFYLALLEFIVSFPSRFVNLSLLAFFSLDFCSYPTSPSFYCPTFSHLFERACDEIHVWILRWESRSCSFDGHSFRLLPLSSSTLGVHSFRDRFESRTQVLRSPHVFRTILFTPTALLVFCCHLCVCLRTPDPTDVITYTQFRA